MFNIKNSAARRTIKSNKEYIINEIMSIHGRSNIDYVFFETLRQKGILKIDKNKMQDLLKFSTRLQNVAVASPADNSVTNSETNLTPNVNKHEDITKLHQDNNPEQINVFPGNMEARKIRRVKGAYIPVENIIELFKNADKSTIVHEFAGTPLYENFAKKMFAVLQTSNKHEDIKRESKKSCFVILFFKIKD